MDIILPSLLLLNIQLQLYTLQFSLEDLEISVLLLVELQKKETFEICISIKFQILDLVEKNNLLKWNARKIQFVIGSFSKMLWLFVSFHFQIICYENLYYFLFISHMNIFTFRLKFFAEYILLQKLFRVK